MLATRTIAIAIAFHASTGCGGLSAFNYAGDGACDTAAGCADPTADADTDADSDSDTDSDTDADTDADTTDVEDCSDGADNDGDGDRDCEDRDCEPECDEDNDGSFADADCDDGEPASYPGAVEICDTLDNDCDNLEDEDDDGDGTRVCNDCDDTNSNAYPDAPELCDGVDTDCDGIDLPNWSDDFEGGPPIGAPYSVGGNDGFGFSMTLPHAGSYSVKSGAIADNENSTVTLTVNLCAPGSVSFWHAEETEATYDYLKFGIDGVEAGRWSGTNPYVQGIYNLPAGNHTLEWRYTKDGSVSTGQDATWVDDIEVIGGTP